MDHRATEPVKAVIGHPAEGDALPGSKKPFWVQCGKCRHQWAAAFLPMEAELFGKVAGKACCPMCGNGPKGNFVAKQHDGVLTEPTAAQGTGA